MEENRFDNFEQNKALPNATAVLVLGIASIVSCCCYGIISIILGIVGLVLARKDNELYLQNPSVYNNYKNIKTGKILCIIGIVLGAIYLIYMICIIALFGMENLGNSSEMQAKIREILGK